METLGRLGAKEYTKEIAELLKDIDSLVRGSAAFALSLLRAKEYTKEIAKLLKNKESKGAAALTLGKLQAKEYAREVAKLLSDSSSCYIYDEVKHEMVKTTVAAVAA